MSPSYAANLIGADPGRASLSLGLSSVEDEYFGCIKALNQLLTDTIMLRDLYKKHQWQVTGNAFYPLHLLFERHCGEQSILIDMIAERITALGGTPLLMPRDVAKLTRVTHPHSSREKPARAITRMLDAHEIILNLANNIADMADLSKDEITYGLISGDLVYRNELQVWYLLQHIADITPDRHAA